MGNLPKFEGRDVIRSAVQITKAGDGLSDALKMAPEALHYGDEVWFVLRGEVTKVNHVPASAGSEEMARVHVITTQEIARVEEADVGRLLAQARDAHKRRVEEAQGIERIPGIDDALADLGHDAADDEAFGDDLADSSDLDEGEVEVGTVDNVESITAAGKAKAKAGR